MDTLLFEYHTAHNRFAMLLSELSKYRTKLKAGVEIGHFDNVVENCRASLQTMVDTSDKTEPEFIEFKLRTLKKIEEMSSSDIPTMPTRWMESPFDVYTNRK